MKLRYLFPSLLAVVAMLVSCSNDFEASYLGEIRVSQSSVSIPVEGGSATIDLTAADSWSFDASTLPSWLTVTPTSGSAGQTTVTFSADKAKGSNSATVKVSCAGQLQEINVIQMGEKTEAVASTCAEVIAGPDSKTYRVTGVCTKIANTTYGNWYINDGTGEVYIYGTLDKNGGTKNYLSWGMEVGDIVTVEGPKTTYNGTVELVDVTVVKLEKSLIKVDSLTVDGVVSSELPVDGGDITAHLTCKGTGVAVEIPADAKSWLGVTSSTVGTNPTVTFYAKANEGGDRSATVTFKTTDGTSEYTSQATI